MENETKKEVKSKEQSEAIQSLVDLILSVERGQAQLIESLQTKALAKVFIDGLSQSGDSSISLSSGSNEFYLKNWLIITPSGATNPTITIDNLQIPVAVGTSTSCPVGMRIRKNTKIVLNFGSTGVGYLSINGEIYPKDGHL